MNTTIRKPKAGSAISDSPDPVKFINRELSWLNFNARVLAEAAVPELPLLEKLKFIAIFSSNLDEFFMVRVAGLLHLIRAKVTDRDPAGFTVQEQLSAIRQKVTRLIRKQQELLNDKILPELKKNGVEIIRYDHLSPAEKLKMNKVFLREILPALTPLAIDHAQPFPLLNSGMLELALKLHFPKRNKTITAFVEIPELTGRFIKLPSNENDPQVRFVAAEELISANIHELFPGGKITGKQLFRITRDMDYSIDPEDTAEDLLHILQDKLNQRSRRMPVRLEYSTRIYDRSLLNDLNKFLALKKDFCYPVTGLLHLKQLFQLLRQLERPDLCYLPGHPVVPELFSEYPTVFDAIKEQGDILLAHPAQSFSPIIRLLEEAADDPAVLAIKQTLYRVSGNSPVINALQKAARNGKQVTVLVELKARFDESNNIAWSELLDQAGAHVVYGVPGLKVHSKMLLIVRKEQDDLCRYVHFGTGNYNDETAKTYTDLSLLSNDPALADDAANLFNFISGNLEPHTPWQAISAAPFDLRDNLKKLIRNEIRQGKKGRIIAKMNSLSDPELINLLHLAATAGVEIDLIVRGICCLRPPVNCRNLRIISIIDRYLEHSRIFFFGSSGKLFCSSADWMPRNLDRRVETMFPIKDPQNRKIILNILKLHLNDRAKAWKLTSFGNYSRPAGGIGSQQKIDQFLTEQ